MPKFIKTIDKSYMRVNNCCPNCESPLVSFRGHSEEGSIYCFQCWEITFESCLKENVEVKNKSFLIKLKNNIHGYLVNEYNSDKGFIHNRYEMAKIFNSKKEAKLYILKKKMDMDLYEIINFDYIGAKKVYRKVDLYINDGEIDLFVSDSFYQKIFETLEDLNIYEKL